MATGLKKTDFFATGRTGDEFIGLLYIVVRGKVPGW
jgi:hypothetical protein